MRIFYLALIVLFTVVLTDAQTSRSYMEKEIVGQSVYGPISEVPLHAGTWVEWDSTGDNIIMMDGSRWKKSKSIDGNIHYGYVGTSGQSQPFTQYIETIFNADFSKMNIRYNFGPMGMAIPMIGKFTCLGYGKELAEEWINMPDEE